MRTLFRKIAVLTLLVAIAAVVGVCVWLFGADRNVGTPVQSGPKATSEQPEAKPLTLEEAERLAVALTSQDQMTYDAVWSTDDPPPLAPVGVKIVVDVTPGSVESSVKYGVGGAKAVVTMPDGRKIGVVISVVLSRNRWLVHDMEEVR